MLLTGELEWSWRFFVCQEVIWRQRATDSVGGHRCYALKQAHIWMQFAETAASAMKPLGIVPI